MFNDILNDIWNNYRGRLLCSVFGLFIGVVVLWLGFFQALFLMICIGLGFLSATSWIRKRICWSGWIGCCLPAITDNGGGGKR